MISHPFFDPSRSYESNYQEGPFGAFADSKKILRSGEPSHTFLGHQVYVPFGIPAGPLLNSAFVAAAFQKGFDIATYKTVRTAAHPCHPHPNVLAVHVEGDLTLADAAEELTADSDYTQPLSITNSFGVPSKDPDEWQPDMVKAAQSAGKGQVMVGSFQGTKDQSGSIEHFIRDYVLAAELVAETGTHILEANLSCPNEGTADLLCFDIERVQLIAERIKNKIGDTPLLLKFAYFENDEHLSEMIRAIGSIVQGISVINTIPAAIVDAKGSQALPGEGRLRSGVCGAGIKWAGVEMVERLYKHRTEHQFDFAIVGVGGVTRPEDYKEYREAGADAVQSATGAMWNVSLAEEIYKGLYE